jgi:hypothetical protein
MKGWSAGNGAGLRAGASAAIVFALVAGGCAKTPVFLPSHDFDRPTDMAFS